MVKELHEQFYIQFKGQLEMVNFMNRQADKTESLQPG